MAAAWAVLLLAWAPLAAASAYPAPTNLQATYDESTDAVTFSWDAVMDSSNVSPDEYRLYRNGAQVAAVTSGTTVSEDLSGWSAGQRTYHVTAVWGPRESDPSESVTLLRGPGIPPSCPLVSVSIFTNPPGIGYNIIEDCIPEP